MRRFIISLGVATFVFLLILLPFENKRSSSHLVGPSVERQLENIATMEDISSALIKAGYSQDAANANGRFSKHINLSGESNENLFCWIWIDTDTPQTNPTVCSNTSRQYDTIVHNIYTYSSWIDIYAYECVKSISDSVIEEELLLLLEYIAQ